MENGLVKSHRTWPSSTNSCKNGRSVELGTTKRWLHLNLGRFLHQCLVGMFCYDHMIDSVTVFDTQKRVIQASFGQRFHILANDLFWYWEVFFLGLFLPPTTFHHEKNSGYGIFDDAVYRSWSKIPGFGIRNPRVASRISETTESILETFNCWWREWSLHFCFNQVSYLLTGATTTPRFLHPTNAMTSTMLNVFFPFSRAIWVMWTVLKHHFCSTCWS